MGKVLSEFGNIIGPGVSDPAKADKVNGATSGNFAGLDANGNLTDSGKKPSDFEPALDLTTETPTPANPLSFTTDSEQAARSCKIIFEPIQAGSGDPSPSNIRAIGGYDKAELAVPRKNLLNGTAVANWLKSKNSSVNLTDEYIDYAASYIQGFDETFFKFPAGEKTYTLILKGSATNGYWNLKWTDTSGNLHVLASAPGETSTIAVTLQNPATLCFVWGSGWTTLYYKECGIFEGEVSTSQFESYDPITDVGEALPEIIYGGTLDVESGELVVDRAMVDMGSLAWSVDEYNRFLAFIGDVTTGYTNLISEILKADVSPLSGLDIDNTICYYQSHLYVLCSTYDLNQFQEATVGKKLVYLLKTPYILHLTPHQVRLLAGDNVVTTNGTTIQLTYRKGEIASLADISSVAKTVNGLSEKVSIMKIEGVLSNTLNSAVDVYYPEGYNVDNTIILREEVDTGTGTPVWSNMFGTAVGIQVTLYQQSMSVLVRDSNFLGKPFRFYIAKFVS